LPPNKKYYTLHVSGCEAATLKRLKDQHSLPNWRSVRHEKFLAMLDFTSYPDAAAWMKACLDNGYVIVRFDDVNDLDPDTLMDYFKGGHVLMTALISIIR